MPYGFSERMMEEAEKQFPREPSVILYSTPTCIRCHQLVIWLDSQQIAYQVRNLEDAEAITELRLDSVFPRETPVLSVNGYYMLSHHLFSPEGKLNVTRIKDVLEDV